MTGLEDQLTQVQQDGPDDDLLDSQGSFCVLCRQLFRRGLRGSWKGWLDKGCQGMIWLQ